jgi:hypothetical protein
MNRRPHATWRYPRYAGRGCFGLPFAVSILTMGWESSRGIIAAFAQGVSTGPEGYPRRWRMTRSFASGDCNTTRSGSARGRGREEWEITWRVSPANTENLPLITSGAIRLSLKLEDAGAILRKLSLKQQDMQNSIFQESIKTIGAESGRKGLKWERRPDDGRQGERAQARR